MFKSVLNTLLDSQLATQRLVESQLTTRKLLHLHSADMQLKVAC